MTFGIKHSMMRHFKSAHSGIKGQTSFSKKINNGSVSKSALNINSSTSKSVGKVSKKKRRISFEVSSEDEDGDVEELDWQ